MRNRSRSSMSSSMLWVWRRPVNAAASDARRAETTDPSKTRKPPAPKLKPVPEAAVAAVGDTLREQGLAVPAVGGGTTFLQAKTANEVLKAQERRIRLSRLKGELIERARALALVFRLAREARVVLLPGRGFGTQHPSGRVSLANLNESDYRQIGRAMRKLIEEYVERYNAATGKKLDKTKVK